MRRTIAASGEAGTRGRLRPACGRPTLDRAQSGRDRPGRTRRPRSASASRLSKMPNQRMNSRHPGDRRDGAQRLQRRIEQPAQQRRIAGDARRQACRRRRRCRSRRRPAPASPGRGPAIRRCARARRRCEDHRRRRHQATGRRGRRAPRVPSARPSATEDSASPSSASAEPALRWGLRRAGTPPAAMVMLNKGHTSGRRMQAPVIPLPASPGEGEGRSARRHVSVAAR